MKNQKLKSGKGLSEIEGVKSKYRNRENRCQNHNRSSTNQIKNRDSTSSGAPQSQ